MEYGELVKQWEKVDMDYLKKLIRLHNEIVAGEKQAKEFDEFVLNSKEKFNNPDYLQVFAERVELTKEFFEEHAELCKFIYQFMKDNPDWEKLSFGLRTFLRLGLFFDTFEEYIAS